MCGWYIIDTILISIVCFYFMFRDRSKVTAMVDKAIAAYKKAGVDLKSAAAKKAMSQLNGFVSLYTGAIVIRFMWAFCAYFPIVWFMDDTEETRQGIVYCNYAALLLSWVGSLYYPIAGKALIGIPMAHNAVGSLAMAGSAS